MGDGEPLRRLGEILGRSLDTVRRYVRAWREQAPQVLTHFVQWLLEVRPDLSLLPAAERRQAEARPGREHIVDLSLWARRLEAMLVPEGEQMGAPNWSAVNLVLQGIPYWL